MNLVVLSHCGPFDRYAIEQVHRHWPIQHIIRPVWTPAPKSESVWTRLRKAPIGLPVGAAARRVSDCVDRRYYNSLTQKLNLSADADALPAAFTDVPHRQVNLPATVDLLQSFSPDVLLVISAPLLKPPMFEAARLLTLNVHRGIAPQYRGENTLFWPLYYRDFEHVGVTLHRIDRGIDTGPLLAQGYPALEPDDTEVTITAKAAKIAAELLCEVLQAAEAGRAAGQKHVEAGKCYRAADRRLRHDFHYFMRRNLLGERLPNQPARKACYLSTPADTESLANLPI